MIRTLAVAAILAMVAASITHAADTKLTVKVEKADPPKELSDAVRAVLSNQAMNVFDEKGNVLCTVWPVKSLDTKADAGKELKYSHIEESTILGAVKFPNEWKDYRKQKIKPGVYTLRLGIQPMDGDHMGTAPYGEFALLSPAADDTKTDLLEAEELHKLSAKSATRKHPAMMLLFPNKMPPESPAIEAKPKEHVVLSYRVSAGKEKATLGFSLVVVGVTSAE